MNLQVHLILKHQSIDEVISRDSSIGTDDFNGNAFKYRCVLCRASHFIKDGRLYHEIYRGEESQLVFQQRITDSLALVNGGSVNI